MMALERFDQERNNCQTKRFWGYRCIHCGEIVDPVILANRAEMVPYKPPPEKRMGRPPKHR